MRSGGWVRIHEREGGELTFHWDPNFPSDLPLHGVRETPLMSINHGGWGVRKAQKVPENSVFLSLGRSGLARGRCEAKWGRRRGLRGQFPPPTTIHHWLTGTLLQLLQRNDAYNFVAFKEYLVWGRWMRNTWNQ